MSKGIFCGSGLADMGGGTFILYFEFEIVFTDGEVITCCLFQHIDFQSMILSCFEIVFHWYYHLFFQKKNI